MAYIALYRKYRSQSFDELMGQDHVTRTLQNAIRTGHIAQAYLFHGARGCGKTSTARLIARALNCVATPGPNPEPCGVCRMCVSIRENTCLDVTEIDAASETGVDNVREKVIENVQYAPAEARYKVYIIDEVHDLSAKAFDALLKTIEEPPPNVVFVLATTEYHKVPITIRSRCQNYQFKRGTLLDLAAAVQRVITAEGCEAEPDAVQSIARSAEGSWRDALSLLEQVLAYSDGHITAETVNKAIGTVGAATLARVVTTLAASEWDGTLAVAAELVESGMDVRQLLTALQAHLRDLMLIAAAPNHAMQELGADRYALLAPQSHLFDPPTLLAMLGQLSAAEREFRFTNQHRILLETALLRLMPGNAPAPVQAAVSAPRTAPPAPQPLAVAPSVVPKPPPSHEPAPTRYIADELEETREDADESPIMETAPPAAPPSLTLSATPAVSGSAPATPESEPDAGRFAEGVTLDVLQKSWPRILKDFGKVSPAGLSHLSSSEPVALNGKFITLAFEGSFARDRIQNKGREAVEKSINRSLQSDGYKIQCILRDEGHGGQSANPSSEPTAPTGPLSLMEAPEPLAAPSGPSRIMDFDTPQSVAPPAPPKSVPYTNGASQAAKPPPVEPPPAVSRTESKLLEEALNIFGGEVVSVERY